MRTLIVMMALGAMLVGGCKDKKEEPDADEQARAGTAAAVDEDAAGDEGAGQEEGVVVRRVGPEGQKVKMIRKPDQVGKEVEGLIEDGVEKRDRRMHEQ